MAHEQVYGDDRAKRLLGLLKVLAARMPLGKFSLAWFKTLNGLGGGRPLVPGRKVKVVVE